MTEPEFITPPNTLKEKVGDGGVAGAILDKAQSVMKSFVKDYPPVAKLDLKKLLDAMQNYMKEEVTLDKALHDIKAAAIDLKSNGAMFNYPVVSQMGHSLLTFVDNIRYIDEDVVQIIMAHHQSIKAVVDNKQSGDVDKGGETLIKALTGAVSRYYRREDIEPHV